MTRMAVTGASAKAGRAVVRDLLDRGHRVLNIVRVASDVRANADLFTARARVPAEPNSMTARAGPIRHRRACTTFFRRRDAAQ